MRQWEGEVPQQSIKSNKTNDISRRVLCSTELGLKLEAIEVGPNSWQYEPILRVTSPYL